MFFSVLCLLCLCARLLSCALLSPAGKGLASWLSFVPCCRLLGKGWPLGSHLWCLHVTVSLSLSHWYHGSCVVLDSIDS